MNIGSLLVTLGVDATGLAAANVAMANFEKRSTASLAKLNSSLQRAGYLMSTALTLPLTLAGKASFQMAKDFEYSIQKIVGLTGVAQSTVNNWSKELLSIGPQLGRKPKELADALYFISSSGIKGAEAMNVLKLSAKAATAGLGETQTVADLLTSALNAYAGTGLTAAKATDILIAAVREGKAEAEGFSTAMGQVIPIASQLGVSFDQVAGGMAAITLTGSSASQAAVYLKGIFNSLLKASSQGEKALNSVGTSYTELRNILGQQGLIPLMQKLRDIQTKYGDELLSDVLPNIRALSGYLSLAGKNFKYNTELMQRVTNSTGSLGKAFAAVADTIKVRYDKAIAGAQVSMISLGKSIADALLPFLEKLSKKLEELTTWFNGLSESGRKVVLTIAGIAAALGPLALLFSAFVWIIRGLIAAVGYASSAFTVLRAVMLANPWIAAATGVLLLVGAVINYSKTVKRLAEEHDSFNTTLVRVNGTLKKLRDLLPTDYGSMTLDELGAAQEAARQEWVKADKLLKQGLKNRENYSWFEKIFGANKNNDKYIKEQEDKIAKLKKLYEDLGNSYYDVWQKSLIEQEIKKQEKIRVSLEITTQKLKDQQDAVEQLGLEWAKAGSLIHMATLAAIVTPDKNNWWLAAEQKDNKDLLKAKIPDIKTFQHYQIPKDYTKLTTPAFDFTKHDTTPIPLTEMEKFNKEIDLLTLKNNVLGLSYNNLRDQTSFFRTTLDKLWDDGIRPGTKVMDDLIKKIKEMTLLTEVQQTLENSFADLFSFTIDDMKHFSDFLKSWIQSVLQAFQKLAAQLLAQKLVNVIMGIISGGATVGVGAMRNTIIPGLAKGGVVPPGYPNDTYPALLSSGETITPRSFRSLSMQPAIIQGDVRFEIEQDKLVGILQKAMKKNKIF